MNVAHLAVVVYGALTLILAAVLAGMQHSVLGMALAFAASGVTYVFQFVQLFDDGDTNVLLARSLVAMIAFSVLLTLTSVAVSTMGY